MTKILRKMGISICRAFLLMLVTVIMANALDLGPGRKPGSRNREQFSVAEPAAIVLLGAGLLSLGVYAKKKHGKKP
jgi:hypothetical protein